MDKKQNGHKWSNKEKSSALTRILTIFWKNKLKQVSTGHDLWRHGTFFCRKYLVLPHDAMRIPWLLLVTVHLLDLSSLGADEGNTSATQTNSTCITFKIPHYCRNVLTLCEWSSWLLPLFSKAAIAQHFWRFWSSAGRSSRTHTYSHGCISHTDFLVPTSNLQCSWSCELVVGHCNKRSHVQQPNVTLN